MPSIAPLLQKAQSAAREAGAVILDLFRSGRYTTEMKGSRLPVTTADKASHAILTAALRTTGLPVLSEEGGETAYSERKNWDLFWLIDPLDGSEEFLQRREEFTINIALVKKQTAIAGIIYVPCYDRLYMGCREYGAFKVEKIFRTDFPSLSKKPSIDALRKKENLAIAVSRSHLSAATRAFVEQFHHPRLIATGSSLKFMLLLEGEADIYPRLGPTMEWDTAAAHAILHASGRGIYNLDFKSELAYNKPDLHNPFFVAF